MGFGSPLSLRPDSIGVRAGFMARETVTLSDRGQQRAMVLNRVERESLTGEEAAGRVGLSLRQLTLGFLPH